MALYRVKQFLWAAGSYFKKVDTDYINKYLNEDEKKLFNRLNHNDKHHSIRVSKDAVDICKNKSIPVSNDRIAKAALLHDVGKGEFGLNVIEKSTLVLLNNITKGKIKRYKNIRQIDIYYNHAQKGADLLKEFRIYDKEFLDSIRYHHSNKKISNELLDVIRESDNKN